MTKSYKEILKHITTFIFDVDGVLTDARVHYLDNGSEFKSFNVKDGLGIEMLLSIGIEIAVISGRKSIATIRRMKDLGIQNIFIGVTNKLDILKKLIVKLKIDKENIACIGDDLPDIPLMKYVGLSIGVKDAVPQVLEIVDYITKANGGDGAVREVCDFFFII